MHTFLAILVIFMAPTPADPHGHVALSGFKADSMEQCYAKLGPTISSISQMTGVAHVDGLCVSAENPNDKSA